MRSNFDNAKSVGWQVVADEVTQLREVLARIERKLDRQVHVQGGSEAQPLSITGFAERVGVTRGTVHRWITIGRVRLKNGRIPPSELRRFGL